MTVKEAKVLTELGIHIVEECDQEECDLCGKVAELKAMCHTDETVFQVCDECADYCYSVNEETTPRPSKKAGRRV